MGISPELEYYFYWPETMRSNFLFTRRFRRFTSLFPFSGNLNDIRASRRDIERHREAQEFPAFWVDKPHWVNMLDADDVGHSAFQTSSPIGWYRGAAQDER
jgi:hypothetical protein